MDLVMVHYEIASVPPAGKKVAINYLLGLFEHHALSRKCFCDISVIY